MNRYHLRDEFVDADSERRLLAAIAADPRTHRDLALSAPTDLAVAESDAWAAVCRALHAGTPPEVPAGWAPAEDPIAILERLRELHRRREIADIAESLSSDLRTDSFSASKVVSRLDENLRLVRRNVSAPTSGKLVWTRDLLPEISADVEARRVRRLQDPRGYAGVPTGIRTLDELLDGLQPGLHISAGGPGVGKTTLAMQISERAGEKAPVLYVTCENSPKNLILRAICRHPKVDFKRVTRGYEDPERFREATANWLERAGSIAVIAGDSALTVDSLRQLVVSAVTEKRSSTCLVVIDYLQLLAKLACEFDQLSTVRERVERLGVSLRQEVAVGLGCPVLAISSLNRSQGDYGGTRRKHIPPLDALKETGDLEYAADTVIFLSDREESRASQSPRLLTMSVAKNRHGERRTINLVFDAARGTILEEAHE